MTPKFIVLEGIDGAGKSTQARLLSEYLSSRSIPNIVTREPLDSGICDEIRAILFNNMHGLYGRRKQDVLAFESEILLWFASRAQHISTVIKPAMEEGKWVVCDRFTYSTYAYQGAVDGFFDDAALNKIRMLEENFQFDVHPDIIFLLDVKVEFAMGRLLERDVVLNRADNCENLSNVRDLYLTIPEDLRSRSIHKVIDANRPRKEVSYNMVNEMDRLGLFKI